MKINFIERQDSADLFLNLLVWAVATILLTRFYLALTGNPQISFGQWHLTHVLWGGLFMLISIILMINFYGTGIKKISSIIGGIGWGWFIDEIGKYVTKDNDYWFQPAIIIIYISFIILFLVYRYFKKYQSKKDIRNSVIFDFNKIIDSPAFLDSNNPELFALSKNLKKIINNYQIDTIKPKNSDYYINYFLNIAYHKILTHRFFVFILSIYSLYFSLDKIIDFIRIILSPQKMLIIERFYHSYDFISKTDTYMIIFKIFFDSTSALLLLIGWYFYLVKKKKEGFTYFSYGLLVNIFLSSIFRFYFEQFSAVFSLFLSLIVLIWVNNFRRDTKSIL